MASLSILSEGGLMVGCANPIYLTSEADYREGAKLTFEVLEADASSLRRLLGKIDTFGIDPREPVFIAELTSLEPCESTVEALALLRDKPAMRGTLTVFRTVSFGDNTD
jgi:hypothetical protein